MRPFRGACALPVVRGPAGAGAFSGVVRALRQLGRRDAAAGTFRSARARGPAAAERRARALILIRRRGTPGCTRARRAYTLSLRRLRHLVTPRFALNHRRRHRHPIIPNTRLHTHTQGLVYVFFFFSAPNILAAYLTRKVILAPLRILCIFFFVSFLSILPSSS